MSGSSRGPTGPADRWLSGVLYAAASLSFAVAGYIAVVLGGAEGWLCTALAGGHLALVLLRSDTRAAAGALALGPAVVVTGFALAPAALWLPLFPLSLVLAAAGALVLQARRAGLLTRLDEPRPLAPLLWAALPLTALVLVVTLVVYLGVLVLPEPVLRPGAVSDASPTQTPGQGGGSPEAQDALDTFEQIFPSGMDLAGGVTQLQRETVMEVRPQPPADLGSLYLRGMVLDVLEADGASFRSADGMLYRAPGADGWVHLARPAGRAPSHELELRQQPVLIRRGNLGILFAPERLLATDFAPVRHDPDGLLIALEPDAEAEWLTFALRYQERRARYLDLARGSSAHPDPLYVSVPAGPEVDVLRRTAQDLTRGIGGDFERVQAVVGWFRSEFTYALEVTEFPGLAGMVEFLNARRGPCTYYAGASALMLRSLGVPTRIATGFLAQEYDADLGLYTVTTREGHAWIEVYFEGFGWVTFDPTPTEQRAAALEAMFQLEDDPQGLRPWAEELVGSLERWAESGGEVSAMRDFAVQLGRGPRAAWESARRAPLLALAVGAVLVLVWLLPRLRRRARVRASQSAEPADPHTASLTQALLAALERRGYPKPRTHTLREFAAAVMGAAGPELEPLGAQAELLYRARFGQVPLTPPEEARLRAFVEDLGKIPGAAGTG